MAAAVAAVLAGPAAHVDGGLSVTADPRLEALVFAHGWLVDRGAEEGAEKAVIRPVTP
jgi:hypothetical protein